MPHRRLAHALLLLTVCALGCGGDGLVEFQGSVTYDKKPIAKGTISFTSLDGTGPSSEAAIIDGQYTAKAIPGKKRVRIQGYEKVGEYRLSPDSPVLDDFKPLVPALYNDQSTLETEIPAAPKAPLNFDLEVPAK